MNFNNFNFHPKVAAGCLAAGFTTPTPIQAQSIPRILQSRDVVGLAQTGTGKTAAFGLPILHRLMKGRRGSIRALVVAPTRELADQINVSLNLLGKGTGLRSAAIYGGVGINQQISKLRRGIEIVVACPGRLLDHISQSTINLSRIEVLVLDEADRMFDMGFLPDVRKIVKNLPSARQTLLFSATMPNEIRTLSREILRDPETVQVDNVAPATTVRHALYPVARHLKTDLLMDLLRKTDTESVLVFTRTRHRAKRLGEKLDKRGFRAASLQGDLPQSKRQKALDGFRAGRFKILVATDIAARGIDVSKVSHVINFDVPDTADNYIHRIGRTGRAARNGEAFTMVTEDDKGMVGTIERLLGASLDFRYLEGFDYGLTDSGRPVQQDRRPAWHGKPASRGFGGRKDRLSGRARKTRAVRPETS